MSNQMQRATALAIAAAGMSLLLSQPAQAKPKTGDSINGSGAAGTGTFSLNATDNKKGQASGNAFFSLGIGDFTGTVSDVTVTGAAGCLGGTVTTSTISGYPAGSFFAVFVLDSTISPSGTDQLVLQLDPVTPFLAPCTSQTTLVSPAGVVGDVVLIDAAP